MKTKVVNTAICSVKCKGCVRKKKAGDKAAAGNVNAQYDCPAMVRILRKRITAIIVFAVVGSSMQSSFAQDPGLDLEGQSEPDRAGTGSAAATTSNRECFRKDNRAQDTLFIKQPVPDRDTTMYWENKPETCSVKGTSVTMRANGEKYLWGDSHDFDVDFPYSHFYCRYIAGNFSTETTVLLTDNWKYGNAGLLIRLSQSNWIKLYVGKEMDVLRLNTVYAGDVTHIDYATAPLCTGRNKIWLRISCNNGALRLSYSANGRAYETVRILNMPAGYTSAQVGLMADAPMSTGFDASFEAFSVRHKAAA